ncbi:MAG: heparinase II/III family protein, partial [Gemmatimonadota bacterium]|nr:heparinase II/III family protein [Gemmatimonadota bacterium]
MEVSGPAVKTSVIWILLLVLACTTLPAAPAPVLPGHPRLLIRAESGGDPRIVTIEMIRKRARDPRFDRFRKRLTHSMPNLAMRALAYDDPAAADSAIAMLIKPIRFRGTGWDGYKLMFSSLAFDWLYNHPKFDQWEKAQAVDQITAGARYLYSVLREEQQGTTNDYNTLFHPRTNGFTMGLAAAGYALWDDSGEAGKWIGFDNEAARWVKFANDYFDRDILPARHLLGGSVHNGCGYGRHYVMCMTGHYLSLVYTATGRDQWTEIREHQDDWAAREALWVIYSRQPDGLMVKYGDCFRRTSERFSFRVIAERNWHYREPVMQGYLNFLVEEQPESVFELGHDYMAYLYYDPARKPVAPVSSLPKYTVFGPHGLGQIVWRGWERNDPWIFFKCGDYFTNHDHYDQGHIEVFRHSPLLTEAGAYAGFYSEFRMDFYRKSISHNTVLVVDPDDSADEGGQRVYMNQDLGTMKEYLADLGAETGDIIAYQEGEELCYLCADLTAAYPRERVQRLTRELAWVADRYLVVRDRVTLANQHGKKFLPKVLWHCPVAPEIGKDRFTVKRGEGQV